MKTDDNAVAQLNTILSIINSCTELDLPNGAKGAIWKEELVNKIQKALETDKENPKFIRTPVTYGDCNKKTCVCYNQKHLDRYGKGSRVVECDQHSVLIQRGL